MATQLKKLSFALATIFAATQQPVMAAEGGSSSLTEAFSDSKVKLSWRYRYEGVDQDGIDEDATANTIKARLTATTGSYSGLQAVVEFDYVAELFDEDYNNTINGETTYPVVADPDGSDLNQAFLKYKGKSSTFSFGRQRINHNNQRFVGGVAWRQNEQTFDAVRWQSKVSGDLSLDYSYAYRVNRIFGSKNPNGDLDVDLHMFNAKYNIGKGQNLAAFFYSMDFDDALALSNRTFGLDYTLKADNGLGLHLAYASQSDTGDNPVDYDADYYAIDVSAKLSKVTLTAGFESLGADNGKGFVTPLATLHKFQGWTDKFLGTPGTGVEDLWFKAATKVSGVGMAVVYHQFDAETGGGDLGSELGFVANYAFNPNYKLLFKYASYDSDGHATDTDKVWLQLAASY